MCGPSCDSDTLVWYGASYARRDLEEAVRELTKLTDTSHLVSRRSYTSCYDSGSWQHLHEDAASLLHFLAEFQAIQVPTMYSISLQPCKCMLCPDGSALVGISMMCCSSKIFLALAAKAMLTDQRICTLPLICYCDGWSHLDCCMSPNRRTI